MWQILGPPGTVARLGNYILGYLHDIHIEDCIGQNEGGSANKPKQDYLKLTRISCIHLKLKAIFLMKNSKLKYIKPQFAGLLGKIAGSAKFPQTGPIPI